MQNLSEIVDFLTHLEKIEPTKEKSKMFLMLTLNNLHATCSSLLAAWDVSPVPESILGVCRQIGEFIFMSKCTC